MIAFAYYLLKVIICSGVLFLYYHIALRNKLFHQWNRFYLLTSVFISLVAPIVQVSIMHQINGEPNKAIQLLQVFQSADGYLEEVTVSGRQGVSSEQWLMGLYIAISILLFLSVLLSLRKIFTIIRSHTIQWIERIKFINTNAQGTPFSFFNYILWNKEIDLQTETGKQIFQHELVHVKEKHTLDKLFIQSILIVFWCNPFFWLIRRELQLIHEFIADKKSVGEHGTAALAAMILSSSYPAQFNSLTNQFFQTSIKRRLAMLTKIQNVKFNYISRILALPILAVTVLAFTLRTKTAIVSSVKLDKTITVVIDAGHGIMENGKPNGVSVNGISEDNLVLSIANKIKELNSNNQIKIILTRTSDKIIDLHKRVDIARENNADLFISLHIDAKTDHPDSGITSEKSLNSGFGIYVSNKQPSFQTQSETLGSIVREELNSIYPTNPYLLKRKVGIWVLDQNVCPSVLLECGFLNDDKDREFISREKNQTAVAQKILLAIERYASNQQSTQKIIGETTSKVQVKDVVLKNPTQPTQKDTQKLDIKTNWQNNPPLFIVDGEEMSKTDVEKIEPETIESIDVLKGTSATDKYREKGKNGAIVIKLKPINVNSITVSDVVIRKVSANSEQAEKIKIPEGDNIEVRDVILEKVNVDTIPKNQPIFSKVEIEAAVDKDEWMEFLRKNLQPVIENAAAKGMKPGTYTVNVKFIVKKDGSLTNIKTLNDPGYELATKTIVFMKNSPKWKPGIQNGKPVNSYHTQPITFVIQEQ